MTNSRNAQARQTLVTGGTGKTGRRVTERLIARGAQPHVGSRSGTPPFSWEDPNTWEPALDGADSLYIAFQPDLAFPGAADIVGQLSRLAVDKGVHRIVVLSGRGEDGALAAEQAVQQAGAEWTVVRCSWFNQNFSESFFQPPVMAGELAVPAGDAMEPFVDADDIADVAVAALTDGAHAGKVYELTGPRLLSFDDIANELSQVTGRTIRYVRITDAEFRAYLKENDLPEELADLFSEVLDGRNAHLMDGVQQALGRAPKDFAQFAREAAAAGAWTP
ncbi:NmrA family NAD(P)-binding protein [Lipingzhangella sp. LS1_29]|uniref:NmrA family NAD(P)-binding protein n=1 Tax=Lipingzhangella rawalii TaxID=2055835 RepID=A0ABU2HAX3_9ACTN|nr:NmrA family NAD(P)-binding protein [Lipingzhangella rawalii]MDS1272471.1 NmrA family NAD(P)-binding protein [Lipingzhangella rawalii]